MDVERDLPAGDFSTWLRRTRHALLHDSGADVACGECIGCCTSSYFIHITPEETGVLGRIPKDVLVAAPGLPKGHVLMGYDTNGRCPMLANGKCSIYEHRPHTCRNYDCRVFTAAGIVAGADDKAEINTRVQRWNFAYPTARDRDEHRAVQAAASFMRQHPESFPSGRVPSDPSQLAILAIKAYEVFVEGESTSNLGGTRSASDVANAIVDTCRRFDAGMAGSMGHSPRSDNSSARNRTWIP